MQPSLKECLTAHRTSAPAGETALLDRSSVHRKVHDLIHQAEHRMGLHSQVRRHLHDTGAFLLPNRPQLVPQRIYVLGSCTKRQPPYISELPKATPVII